MLMKALSREEARARQQDDFSQNNCRLQRSNFEPQTAASPAVVVVVVVVVVAAAGSFPKRSRSSS